ncbi:hypothetical protein PMAYCL1PPCAC_03815, partial [Pristionchus mayeri]
SLPHFDLGPMQRLLVFLFLSILVLVAALPAPQEQEWREKRLSQQALIRLLMRNDRTASMDGLHMGKRGGMEIERQTRDSSAHCFLSPIQCWNNRRRR